MSTTQVETKKWYQSKIFWFGALLLLTTGSNFFTGWMSGMGVTPEQFEVVNEASEEIQDVVGRIKNGEKVISALTALFGVVISVTRVWFTDALMPQSLNK